MFTYSINIAELVKGQNDSFYRHWGVIKLCDGIDKAEAKARFRRLIAAFPAPHWQCSLDESPLKSFRRIDAT